MFYRRFYSSFLSTKLTMILLFTAQNDRMKIKSPKFQSIVDVKNNKINTNCPIRWMGVLVMIRFCMNLDICLHVYLKARVGLESLSDIPRAWVKYYRPEWGYIR
jgi:hypothetical protein